MLRLWYGYALGPELVHNIVQLLRSWNGLVFLSMPTISGSCSLCCSMNWIISCMVRETGRRWTSDSTLSCSTSFLAACRFDIVAMVTVVWQNDRRWKFSLWLVFLSLTVRLCSRCLWNRPFTTVRGHVIPITQSQGCHLDMKWRHTTLTTTQQHSYSNSNNGKRKRPQRCAKLSYWTVITLASLKFFCKAGILLGFYYCWSKNCFTFLSKKQELNP